MQALPSEGILVASGLATRRRKMHYSGTWSHTDRADLKAPKDLAKDAFGLMIDEKFNRVFTTVTGNGAHRLRQNRLVKHGVWEEKHASGEIHYHFVMLAEEAWCFVPFVRLLWAEKICVDMSTDHDYYWTSFVYLAVPGAAPGDKTEADLDADPWLSARHPTIRHSIEDIPRGARAVDKARVRRYLGAQQGGESPSKNVALTDKDFASHLVAKGLESVLALQAWVTTSRHELRENPDSLALDEQMTLIGMEAYMFKNQADLARRIDFAFACARAPQLFYMQSKTAWTLVRGAFDMQCVCGGRWGPLTDDLLAKQVQAYRSEWPADEKPTPLAIKAALRNALQKGCAKGTNVFFYGPRDAGKSHLLKPLISLFGEYAFTRPVGNRSNYPLQDIFEKKVIVLQDLRTDTFKLPFADLLVWFEGESVRVPLPQNHYRGDRTYNERAPVFASAGSKLRISPQEAAMLLLDGSRQNEMMDARWNYFHMPASMQDGVECLPCARCFAEWLGE
jgi:hypothetical protein